MWKLEPPVDHPSCRRGHREIRADAPQFTVRAQRAHTVQSVGTRCSVGAPGPRHSLWQGLPLHAMHSLNPTGSG
jgi:hypothetical protein